MVGGAVTGGRVVGGGVDGCGDVVGFGVDRPGVADVVSGDPPAAAFSLVGEPVPLVTAGWGEDAPSGPAAAEACCSTSAAWRAGDRVGELAVDARLELLLAGHQRAGSGLLSLQVRLDVLLGAGRCGQRRHQLGVELLRGLEVVDHLFPFADADRRVPTATGQVPLASVQRERQRVPLVETGVRGQGVAGRVRAARRHRRTGGPGTALDVGLPGGQLAAADLGLIELFTERVELLLQGDEALGDLVGAGLQVTDVVSTGSWHGHHGEERADRECQRDELRHAVVSDRASVVVFRLRFRHTQNLCYGVASPT